MTRLLSLLALCGLLAAPALAQRAPAGTPATFAGLSDGLAFVENRGQWPDDVLFRARLGGTAVWVTADGLTLDFYEVAREGPPTLDSLRGARPEAARWRGHVVRMAFEGGRARNAAGRGLRGTYHNYFLGNDPSRWAPRVPLYDEVVLEGLYDGVDLRLYADGGLLRYDLVLAPGAEVSQIRMRLEGAGGVTVTEVGTLRMETALGPVEHRGLQAYQEGAGGRQAVVESAFAVGADGMVGFEVRGADPARPLVIDPLIWATFLGGSFTEYAYAIDTSADGSVLVTGWTNSINFPTTPSAYDTSFNGGSYDGFVAKLSADGSTLVYSTYLGGSESDIAEHAAVGPDGSATVVGWTAGMGFPTTPGAFDTSYNGGGNDGFVVRLSADGAALLYSTFLGGGGYDNVSAIYLGDDGNATVAGRTTSSDFPTTPNAFDPSHNGSADAFIARLSPDGSDLVFSTFLGGSGNDYAWGIVLGEDGLMTVAGHTGSVNFPTTPGAFDTSHNGLDDAFAARLSADGSSLVFSTFLGGAQDDRANDAALGPDGSVTIAGITRSTDFPTTPNAFDPSHNGSADAFIARLSPDGSDLVFSTFLGGSGNDYAWGIVLGEDGLMTVAGHTGSVNFPTTPGAFDTSHNGLDDAFITRLSANGAVLLYSTFLGGTGDDVILDLSLGADGSVTASGHTRSADFPVTPGAFAPSYNGAGDAFVSRLEIDLPRS